MFFSGTPLLSDPQSFLFYPPNIIFLFLPIDQAFITSFILHSFFAGVGVFITAKAGLGFSQMSSIFTAILYIVFPRTAGFLEAGHFGFVATTTWLPYLLFAVINLIKSPNIKWSIVFAISLSGLFFTFTIVFIVAAAFASIILFVVGSYLLLEKHFLKTLIFGIIFTVGLTAITLFPQIEWLPQTTRLILLKDRDVYPKWNGKIEFIKAIFPYVLGEKGFVDKLDNEKWIATGIFISFLALIGLFKLKNRFKLLIICLVSGTILISLNNISPLQSLLLKSDWYVLGRVSTRIWFIIILSLVFLSGFGFETLQRIR